MSGARGCDNLFLCKRCSSCFSPHSIDEDADVPLAAALAFQE